MTISRSSDSDPSAFYTIARETNNGGKQRVRLAGCPAFFAKEVTDLYTTPSTNT